MRLTESRPVANCIYNLLRYTKVVISGFEWDDDNTGHIAKHEFSPDEVEEVFASEHKVRRAREKICIALGTTLEGLGVRCISEIE